MPDALPTWLAPVAGLGLGAIYFGGLWWTVCHAASFRRPALSMLVSVLVRMSVTLAGFLLVAGASWQRLLLCLAGFVAARVVVSGWVRSATRVPNGPEVLHAP